MAANTIVIDLSEGPSDRARKREELVQQSAFDTAKSIILRAMQQSAALRRPSSNGITRAAIECIDPDTVLISAGVENQYGHPEKSALRIFRSVGADVFMTNEGLGTSYKTTVTSTDISTSEYF